MISKFGSFGASSLGVSTITYSSLFACCASIGNDETTGRGTSGRSGNDVNIGTGSKSQ